MGAGMDTLEGAGTDARNGMGRVALILGFLAIAASVVTVATLDALFSTSDNQATTTLNALLSSSAGAIFVLGPAAVLTGMVGRHRVYMENATNNGTATLGLVLGIVSMFPLLYIFFIFAGFLFGGGSD
jgi:hypothetical protein